MALIANVQSAEVAQPGKKPFDFPAPLVAAQRAPILGFGTFASPAMWRDEFDAPLSKIAVHRVGIIGTIPHQPLWCRIHEAGG